MSPQPTYRKIVDCPDCGVVVKVPQGLMFAEAHSCDPRPRVRRTTRGTSAVPTKVDATDTFPEWPASADQEQEA